MNEMEAVGVSSAPAHGAEAELTIVDYASMAWRHRRLIGALVIGAVLVALIGSLVLPKAYESTGAVLAPQEGQTSSLLAGLAGSTLLQQIPGFSAPSLSPNRDMLVSILRSRTVAETVARRFGLKARYGAEFLEDAVKELQEKRMRVDVSKENVILITVEDVDPRIAADMANFYLQELDRLATEYGTREAGQQRVFMSGQLAGAKVDLGKGEELLQRFQEKNRAIVLQDQTRGAIEAAARLKGEIIASEVQLQVLRSFATDANSDVVALRRRIEEMKRQLADMQYGDENGGAPPSGKGQDRRELYVPPARVPELGLELVRLTRDVKIQEALVAVLTQQLEQARLGEAKDLPVVRVLDRGVPAERHARPRLGLNVAVAGVGSLFVGIFVAFFIEHVRSVRQRTRIV